MKYSISIFVLVTLTLFALSVGKVSAGGEKSEAQKRVDDITAGIPSIIYTDERRYYLNIFKSDEYEQPVGFLRKAFEKQSLLGTMKECSTVIDIPAGTAHGNHSYGGICSVERDNQIYPMMICADMFVGRIAVQLAWHVTGNPDPSKEFATSSDFSKENLMMFVIRNCTGG